MTDIRKAGLLSFSTIMLWAMLNVTVRYFIIEYDCQPLAFACVNSLFCAFTLLLAGKRVNPIPILKNYNTWLLGFSQILKNVCMIYAFVYISSTEANLLTNIEIVLSIIFTWIIFKRRPGVIDFSAMIFILAGCYIILAAMPSNIAYWAAFWILMGSVFMSLRSVLIELHPQNKQTLSARERCAVTGWIMLSTGVVFCLFFVALAILIRFIPAEVVDSSALLSHLPQLNQFYSLPTLAGSAVTGIFFYAVSMYIHFYAISLSTNEYFMMFRSFQAVCTYLVEYIFTLFTALPLSLLTLKDWAAACIIILSSILMIFIRNSKNRTALQFINKNYTLNNDETPLYQILNYNKKGV